MSNYGEELRAKLLIVFDELVEARCCEHGIHNSVVANENALNKMQTIMNDEWIKASKASKALL